MRPRHKAAENARGTPAQRDPVGVASMRPRHKAAENPMGVLSKVTTPRSFNEAAA